MEYSTNDAALNAAEIFKLNYGVLAHHDDLLDCFFVGRHILKELLQVYHLSRIAQVQRSDSD